MKHKMLVLYSSRILCLAVLYCSLNTHAFAVETITPDDWVAVPQQADPIFESLSIPPDAAEKGMWSNLFEWPMNGLHSALLPDGRVLTFGSSPDGSSQNGRWYDVWDPSLGFGSGAHNTIYDDSRQDSFCAAAAYLPDGTMMISGGNGSTNSTIYETGSHSSYTSAASMAEARWYATMINLPDGRPIIMGGMVPYTEGMVNNPDQAIANGWPSMTPEVYENGQWRSLFGAYSRLAFGPDYLRTSYPRAWVAPDGRIFGISADQMWYLDANANSGLGEVVSAGIFKGPYSFNNPVNVGATNSAVMYAPGKILQIGGNGGFNGDELPASNMATLIDITNGNPILIEQPSMTYPRRYPNAIVLANGQVVVTGGATYGNYYNGQPAAPVFSAEIWSEDNNTWTEGSKAAAYRGYHSITTLLANGTILSTGGGTPGPVTNLNGEIYYPPYLFESVNEVSQLATRPTIVAISGLTYDNEAPLQLDLESNESITQLVLLGISSGTHSFNSSQRRIPLSFSQEQFRLTTALPNSFDAPPGYYQLVAVGANGAPSNSVIIGVGQNQAQPPIDPPPYTPPTVEEQIITPEINSGESATYSITPVTGTTYNWTVSDQGSMVGFGNGPEFTHLYTDAGLYVVTLTAQSNEGAITTKTFIQAVSTESSSLSPSSSTPITIESNSDVERIWTVNPDNDTVSVIDAETQRLITEITVGTSPKSVAVAADGRIWVTNKGDATLSVIDPQLLAVVNTIPLPFASQPHGIAFAPDGSAVYVVLEASGQLLKLDPNNGSVMGTAMIDLHARHLAISADSNTILITTFITPPLPGESTATIDILQAKAYVFVVNANTMMVTDAISLQYSDKADTEIQGSGIPNYLAAPVISPDGNNAWIPSKQDNVGRGILRNGQPLNFQNTVRAISSKIDLNTLTELSAQRVDHDNSGLGSAAAFHPNGVYLFVALETSREVAVVNALNGSELFRVSVGIAPQGVAVSADGLTLYVKEFIDRRVSIIDLTDLIQFGQLSATTNATVNVVENEKLPANILNGKALFYDAKDPRLALDGYLSCASCHNDGSHDGRVWDLTGFGEGLRNTIALNGRAGMSHGFLHWSGNFDEVQDFETQIRELAGGTGLMPDTLYTMGTRSEALGDSKTGISSDLDDLAAYVSSLDRFAANPYANADGSMSDSALSGQSVFLNHCASCHGGSGYTLSSDENNLQDIGTLNSDSGLRLGSPLTGLDIPTLRDAWFTAPYLHNGSAPTLLDAILKHSDLNLSNAEIDNVTAFVQQLGNVDFAPSITLTSPSEITITEGDSINVSADAADSDGSIAKVEFFAGTTLIAVDTTAPYGFTWTNASVGSHSLYAVAYDNATNTSVSETVTITVDPKPNVLPNVYLNVPMETSLIEGNNLTITATADDSDGTISRVEFYAGTVLLGTDSSAPYSYTWNNLIVGTYVITAKAYDNDGGTTTSNSFTISVVEPPNMAPEISVTVADNILFEGDPININASANDSDGTITKVEFYADGQLIGFDTSAPYAFIWNGAALGAHTVTAKAYDNDGAVTASNSVSITVQEVPANVPPSVQLTSPTRDTWASRWWGITLKASASDSDGSVTKVEFYANGSLLYTDTTASYSYRWRPSGRGNHQVYVKAYDNSGAVTTSQSVNVYAW